MKLNKFSETIVSRWENFPITIKIVFVALFLLILTPCGFINGGMWISNWLFEVTKRNLSAAELANPEWFSFLGSYFGGVATMLAVWWTVSQTNRQYRQTSDEQKRQNNSAIEDKERQRRLDVLPLILLQPRVTRQSNNLAILLAGAEEKKEKKRIPVDELKPFYEEFDVSEITIVFDSTPSIRPTGLSEEEFQHVKNNGNEEFINGPVTCLTQPRITFVRPFLFINAGKEAAINILISLATPDKQKSTYLHHVFSLMPKEKIKLNCLVDVQNEDVKSVCGNYKLVVTYNDIYANQYYQEFSIDFQNIGESTEWNMGLGIDQMPINKTTENLVSLKQQIPL